ncbi:septal ring lytic transglycosylase RlpA family protein [Pasteurella sp. P03HT]
MIKQKTFRIFTALLVALFAVGAQAETTKKLFGLQGPSLLHQQPEIKSHTYVVRGVRHRTQTTYEARNYSDEGFASFYHRKFHGKRTSNGEMYNENLYTAAHRSLPMNAYVLVTNLRNNRKVVVRINDRGPFIKNRIIDLSRAAAREIGLIGSGVSKVRVEVFSVDQHGKISGPATQTLAKLAKNQDVLNQLEPPVVVDNENRHINGGREKNKKPENITTYKIHLLNFETKNSALALIRRLGRDDIHVELKENGNRFELHFGPLIEKSQVEELKAQLRKLNYSKPLIVYTFSN